MTLTKKRAQQRFQCIKAQSISYTFHLILESGTNYSGLSQIKFSLNIIPKQLQLDCKAKLVQILIINGKKEQNIRHEDGFLHLNCENLFEGQNNVSVIYRNKYTNDGNGCVSFTDVDGKQYVYTGFQPYYANRVFALFDQPDLKATMKLSIISPFEWERVLSNQTPQIDEQFKFEQHLQKIPIHDKNLAHHFYQHAKGRISVFPQTKILPSYLFCFIAGPYKQLKLQQTYKNIPMSLYCIESLFPHMQEMAPFLFEITIQCMKFFQQFFGIDYPFSKYDQVFAHQYKCGAMQNPGVVTLNDQYIWREKVSVESMLDLANTISHELSHHWFGNLSTMKWWDDLWLNQSFAQFISHFCLQKIRDNLKTIKYESSMAAFLARKAWGYHEDQLVTTHPISGEVPNTVVAVSIFDGITYSKGAATMKQLLLLMGEENFSKGLNAYFKKYSFKNATLQQFISQLQQYFDNKDFNLQQWRKIWLSTASLNQLQPIWNPQDLNQQAQLQIIQRPYTQKHPTLRPHQIKIAFFKQDCSYDVIQVMVKPQTNNIVKYNGSNKYKALLLNYEDHTFVKVVIDTYSLNFFSSGNLTKIKDTLTRTMIWRSFFDMVKDGKISSLRYIDVFEQNISNQESDGIFQRHFEYVHSAINYYTPLKYREQLNTRLFYFILNLIPKVDPKLQNRLIILRAQLCDYAYSYLAIKILLSWRNGQYTPLEKYEMTLRQKWKALVRAFARRQISDQEKNKLLQSQLNLDKTDDAKIQQAKCRSLISSQQQFEKLYLSFKDPKNQKSVAMKRSEIFGWNHVYHQERLKIYEKRYFQQIFDISKTLENEQFQLFLEEVIPLNENLGQQIEALKTIKLDADQKYDKNRIDIQKMIGQLQRRQKSYKRLEEFTHL